MKNYSNTVLQSDNQSSPTNLKVMLCCSLTDREFKIVVTKKLNKLQENSKRKLNECKHKIGEQKGYSAKTTENLKKNKTEIWS